MFVTNPNKTNHLTPGLEPKSAGVDSTQNLAYWYINKFL